MKNRHALVDAKTGLVRNVIIWEGHAFTPPVGYYIINDCEGQFGDYWHQDTNTFYTPNKKRRFKDAQGKIGELELTQEEKDTVEQRLHQVYDHAIRVLNLKPVSDITLSDTQIPQE